LAASKIAVDYTINIPKGTVTQAGLDAVGANLKKASGAADKGAWATSMKSALDTETSKTFTVAVTASPDPTTQKQAAATGTTSVANGLAGLSAAAVAVIISAIVIA